MLHHEAHILHGDRDTAARVRLVRAEAVQEDRGAEARRAVFVVADVHRVCVMRIVVDDMLAVLGVKAWEFADVDHLVVIHAGTRVARPIDIVVHLLIGNGAAGVRRDAEGRGEMERPVRRLCVALFRLVHSFLAEEARRRHQNAPVPVRVFFVHGHPCGGLADARDDEELLRRLRLRQFRHPVRRSLLLRSADDAEGRQDQYRQ